MRKAICNLIFTNPIYLVGGCLSAYVHKKWTKMLNINIDIIVLVDKKIYEYKKELEKFYDKVILIDLIEINLSPEYNIQNRYSNWIKYSVTKWHILNLIEYDRILFIDIDMLPIKDDFYSILDMEIPALFFKHARYPEFNKIINKNEISNIKEFNENTYYNSSLNLKKSIDASLVYIKPDKKLYLDYLKFIEICGKNGGYAPLDTKGVDETSLLIFFLYYKNIDVYQIPYEYGTVLYDRTIQYNIDDVKCVNFMSEIKPWTILPLFQWKYEYIWHDIAKKALNKSDIINIIYIDECIKQLINYSNKLIKDNKTSYDYYKNLKTRKKTVNLLFFLYNLKYEDNNDIKKYLSINQIKKIIDYTTNINKELEKFESIVDFKILEKRVL